MADGKNFANERTQELLGGDLGSSERKTVEDVERFGCHVLQVKGTSAGPGWSYTLGVYSTCGKPEVLVVGLQESTALCAVNYAVDSLRAGVNLTEGRHADIVGEVEVEFREVDPAWVKELMGWSKWFYQHWEFAVLQLIYPDLAGRFQWEEGFEERFRQPLLQVGAPVTQTEKDFREAVTPDGRFFDWPFADGPHTQAFLSETVNRGEESVVYVFHDEDGDWQFLGDRMMDGGGPVLVCLHHPIENDASLKELADLPVGWCAERAGAGEPWERYERPHENDTVEEQ